MPAAICLGEILIDFVATTPDVAVGESSGFEKKPGGAPANVAVGISRLGESAAFVGKVGADPFGEYLRRVLEENGVDACGLVQSAKANTTLAFVALGPGGERSFAFYRNPGADTCLEPQDLKAKLFREARIFHFGSLSLTHEPARSATLNALDLAESEGLLISYDPNLREALWPDLATARQQMLGVIHRVHLLKVSDEEACFLSCVSDAVEGAMRLAAMGPRIVLLTRGAKGCAVVRQSEKPLAVPGFEVASVDTTGAGDAFMAAILTQVLQLQIGHEALAGLTETQLLRMARFANAAGAITTTRKGAIPALPAKDAIETLLIHTPPGDRRRDDG